MVRNDPISGSDHIVRRPRSGAVENAHWDDGDARGDAGRCSGDDAGDVGAVAVRLSVTAATPVLGTPPTPAICTRSGPPAPLISPTGPEPRRLSATLTGLTAPKVASLVIAPFTSMITWAEPITPTQISPVPDTGAVTALATVSPVLKFKRIDEVLASATVCGS